MQTKLVSIMNSRAAHDGGTLVKKHALEEEAKLSNLKGNPNDEEASWKKRVDMYRSELADKGRVGWMKRKNTELWKSALACRVYT